MIPYLPYLLSLAAGFFVKWCDETRKILFGLAYGAVVGTVSVVSPAAATVFIPSVLANFAAGKIDTLAHFASLVPLGFLVILSPPSLQAPAAVFFLAAYLDEKIELKLPHPRPLLPLAALLVSLVSRSWDYFLFTALFDAGYLISERLQTGESRAGISNVKRVRPKRGGRQIRQNQRRKA